jgi:hypothetical protein
LQGKGANSERRILVTHFWPAVNCQPRVSARPEWAPHDEERTTMKIVLTSLLCLMLSMPTYAQHSQERQDMESKATVFLWIGISTAAVGITPMIAGAPSIGVPFMLGGGGLIYYAFHLNSKAKQLPSINFGIVPIKKGVKFGMSRSW